MTNPRNLPDWARIGGGNGRFVDKHGTDHAQLRRREARLPITLRFSDPAKRNLRDAYLGRMLLAVEINRANQPGRVVGADDFPKRLEAMVAMENNRAHLTGIVKDLERLLGEDGSAECMETARTLFQWKRQCAAKGIADPTEEPTE